MKTETLPKPPKTLWELCDMILEDVAKCEAAENVKIEMDTWHEKVDRVCYVCAAGAIARERLGVPDAVEWNPDLCQDLEWRHALLAADSLRWGDLAEAYLQMYGEYHLVQYVVTTYSDDTEAWRKDIQNMRDHLKEQGL